MNSSFHIKKSSSFRYFLSKSLLISGCHCFKYWFGGNETRIVLVSHVICVIVVSAFQIHSQCISKLYFSSDMLKTEGKYLLSSQAH